MDQWWRAGRPRMNREVAGATRLFGESGAAPGSNVVGVSATAVAWR